MKKQKQLGLLAFMPNKKDNEDIIAMKNNFNEKCRELSSRKRTRSLAQCDHWNTGASIFERHKVLPKQTDLLAENLGRLLNNHPRYLTFGSEGDPVSWILHVPNWFPSKASEVLGIGANSANKSCHTPVQDFQAEWELHPTMRKQLKIFGRQVFEKRWSQSWGKPMNYSGMVGDMDRPLDQSPNLPFLVEQVNTVMQSATTNSEEKMDQQNKKTQVNSGRVYHEYNACLQNWYQAEDSIGLHSDDESNLYANYPIFSISWGGTRRFLLRPKEVNMSNAKDGNKKKSGATPEPIEVWLKDGDLLVMGGACQRTHKHEVPKPRKKDPVTTNRICWTIRAVKP